MIYYQIVACPTTARCRHWASLQPTKITHFPGQTIKSPKNNYLEIDSDEKRERLDGREELDGLERLDGLDGLD